MANSRADTVRGCRKQDAFGESALIVRVEVRHLGMNDNGDTGRRGREMRSVRSLNVRQLLEEPAVAHDDEFPWLAVTGAAGPARNFEDVAQVRLREWIRPKLTDGAQATQEGNSS